MELSDVEVGMMVVYRPKRGLHEQGVVTGKNDTYVHVRYGSDQHSKSTYPQDLERMDGQ